MSSEEYVWSNLFLAISVTWTCWLCIELHLIAIGRCHQRCGWLWPVSRAEPSREGRCQNQSNLPKSTLLPHNWSNNLKNPHIFLTQQVSKARKAILWHLVTSHFRRKNYDFSSDFVCKNLARKVWRFLWSQLRALAHLLMEISWPADKADIFG